MNRTVETTRRTRLESGARVVTEAVPGSRSISLGAWVGVGSRDEPAPLAGASHFLEHLLFKGTSRWSARQIAEAVDRVGGDFNAHTSKETTAFTVRVPAEHLDLAAELVCDVVRDPAFADHHVEGERSIILEELGAATDAPDDLVFTRLEETLFPDHPLGREVLGDIDTITSMTPEDIRRFHRRWYRPDLLVVAAAGAVEHEEVVASVDGTFAGMEPAVLERVPPEPVTETVVVTPKATEQVHLALGWRSVDQDDPDRYAMALANQIVGGGLSSRLFQGIREDRGLAYAVYSSASAFTDAGMFTVYAATSPHRLDALLAGLDEELEALRTSGVTADELEIARSGFEGATILGLEDTGGRMARLGAGEILRGTVISIDEYLAGIDAVTVADVARVLNRVLDGPRVTSAVGPLTSL